MAAYIKFDGVDGESPNHGTVPAGSVVFFVDGTSVSAADATPGDFAVERGDTSEQKDHKNWINVQSCNMGSHVGSPGTELEFAL